MQSGEKAPGVAGPAQPLLVLDRLGRRFGDVVAVDGVSFDIGRNEFFALLGPSGCGKTTLLRIIAGFEDPDEGGLLLDGVDLLAVPPHRRPVNLMFQSYALFPHMSVRQNIAFGLEREKLPRSEIRSRVEEVLHTVGLTVEGGRRPAQLSGGQRQRVALARAIVKRPRLLLLDEPLSALDTKVRGEMQLELKRLQHEVGISFVVVTHDQTEAMALADRIAVMSRGRVEQIADPVTLYEQPSSVFVASFIGRTNLLPGTVSGGVLRTGDLGDLPVRPGTAAGAAIASIRPEKVRLGRPGAGLRDGRVLEVQFLGGMSTVAVTLAGRREPVVVAMAGPPAFRRDDEVSLQWGPADAVVLLAPPSADDPADDPATDMPPPDAKGRR